MASAAPAPGPGAARVLVVDDEQVLAGTVAAYLGRAGMEARTVADGTQAVAVTQEWAPDVVLLDLGLPGLDGVEVCRRIRTFSDCYVIMVTARDDEVDTLVGLSVGADDYVTKPFSVRELVARVQVVLRRPRTSAPSRSRRRVVGPLAVDPDAREVELDGQPIDLTRTEFDILDALSARPHAVLSRRQLVEEVWGPGWVGDEHLVDVHVAHIRRKLRDDAADPRFVRTVRGIGYRMGPGR